jgi:hypothetical protein
LFRIPICGPFLLPPMSTDAQREGGAGRRVGRDGEGLFPVVVHDPNAVRFDQVRHRRLPLCTDGYDRRQGHARDARADPPPPHRSFESRHAGFDVH